MKNLISLVSGNGLDFYLDKYHAENPAKFATIKISGECFENHTEQIMEDLYSLQKVNLFPSVILGWGTTLNHKLIQAGVEPKFKEGNRITDQFTLEMILEVQQEISAKLKHYSTKYGINIADLSGEKIFDAKQMDSDLGFVGEIEVVNTKPIIDACKNKQIPFILPIGYQKDQMLNINADCAAKEIIKSICPEKYVVLTPTKGILGKDGKIISKISIVDDYPNLIQSGIVSGGMLKKLEEAKSVLEAINNGYSIQITSPEGLLKEIFTYDGCGSKIVQGYHTSIHTSLDDLDIGQIVKTIEKSFGKCLDLEYLNNNPFEKVIIEEDYDGLAILQSVEGLTYMDKLAIVPEMKNKGLGSKILQEVLKCSDNVFWRAKPKSPSNEWYSKKVSENNGGMQCGNNWNVYWIGIEPKKLEYIISFANQKNESLHYRN